MKQLARYKEDVATEQQREVLRREQKIKKFQAMNESIRQGIQSAHREEESPLYQPPVKMVTTNNKSHRKGKGKRGGGKKPSWAKTEADLEAEEEDEIDDLLNFTENLDFEKYVDDLEVRIALAAVMDRIKELEGVNEPDQNENGAPREWNGSEAAHELDEVDSMASTVEDTPHTHTNTAAIERASMKTLRKRVLKALAHGRQKASEGGKWKQSVVEELRATLEGLTASEEGPQPSDRHARFVDDALSSNRNMRHVHSRQSARALVERLDLPEQR